MTRVLNLLGAALPADLMPANPESNPRGFWESIEMARINDALLVDLGRTWGDVRPTPDPNETLTPARLEMYRSDATDFLARSFEGCSLAVLKDPRLCRLMPFWSETAVRAGWRVRCVLSLRHPVEVSGSLARRDQIGRCRAEALWLRYVLESERTTRSFPRTVATFGSLLEDWRALVAQLGAALELDGLQPTGVAEAEVEAFLMADLRNHYREDGVGEGTAVEVFRLLREATAKHSRVSPPRDRLDLLRTDFERDLSELDWVEEYEDERLRAAVERDGHLDELEATKSWGFRVEEELAAKGRELDDLGRWSRELEQGLQAAGANQDQAMQWILQVLDDALHHKASPSSSPVPLHQAFEERAAAARSLRESREALEAQCRAAELRQAELADAMERERSKTHALEAEVVALRQQRGERMERLQRERDQAIAAEGALRLRLEDLEAHAKRLEAKVALFRRVPLARPIWRVLKKLARRS